MSDTEEINLQIWRRRRTTSIIRRAAWLNFKLTLFFWGLAMMFFPPVRVEDILKNELLGQAIHYSWTSIATLGAFISAVGICISFSKNPYTIRNRAVPFELTGLCLMILGPGIYFITQLGLLWADLPEFRGRLALTIFALAMVNAVIARLCTVIPRFHKE